MAEYRVAILSVGEISLHTLLLAIEPFRAANRMGGKRIFNISMLSDGPGPSSTMAGIPVPTMARADYTGVPDLLFILVSYDTADANKRAIFAWLRRMSVSGAMLAGLDYAPLWMAEAGLLNQRRATAHWSTLAAFAERHPEVEVVDALFVRDSKFATSPGQIATLDLSLALLQDWVAPSLCRAVVDELVCLPRAGPQTPQRQTAESMRRSDPAVEFAKAQMQAHIEDPLPLAEIAGVAGVSLRELQRRFRAVLSISPADYYREVRLSKAFHLLIYSQLSIREIGLASGFPVPSTFYRAIRDAFQKSPQEIRSSFEVEPSAPDGRHLGTERLYQTR